MDPQQVVRDETGIMRCRECGFPYALSQTEVAERADRGLAAVEEAIGGVPLDRRHRRPAPDVWSVNAYTAHLAEAAEVIAGRVRVLAEQERPPLPSYDQERAVAEGRYDERRAEDSLARLRVTVRDCVAHVRALPPEAWRRSGHHAEAGEVYLSDIAHDLAHELEHHAGDIRRIGQQVGGTATA